IAVATNQHLIISDLLTHGAQINIRDLWGRSPLHVCAEKGHFLSLQEAQVRGVRQDSNAHGRLLRDKSEYYNCRIFT
ncbi:hypothetical protein GOODEAATRI_020722, partial [Goodea atripinnis]